ncbi:MAG TPA: alpha/beta fold hydrolase [Candidatus Acidoferrales bacterium]|nr:alpha/beta fold hydrolase [Candidatus Acidoferrales bacterium]
MIDTMEVVVDTAAAGARRSGETGRALVFVHGVGSTAAIWDSQLEAFGGEFRTAAIELRGNGALADPDPALITREGFARDVLAVADAAGFDTFTLVGCSLGGVVAFELWKRAPERIDAMVIVGSFAQYPNARAYADGVKAAAREAGDMATFGAVRAAKLGLPPDRTRVTIDQMACKSIPCYLASTEATWTGDYRGVLPTISVPVLVSRGERDVVATRELSDEITAGIPGARYVEIPEAGHVANADNPQAFNRELRAFLSELPVR